MFSRAAQPKWADDTGIVLKGFTDPGSRTATIYLRNIENADEAAGVLAHESSHAITFLRHGTVTPKGKRAAEYAADLRQWIIQNGRRPDAGERASILIETILRRKGAGIENDRED